jgi:hypothetical protein
MPPNSNEELECVADLYKVCASVAQQQAEVAAIFSRKKNSAVFPHPHHSSDFAACVSEGEIVATMLPFPGCP